jgi:transposase-like protein
LPWKLRKALDEKKYFIEEWKREEVSLAELCRRYEISRQTGYKWLERYEQEGEAGLEEHSRAPLHHPQAMSTEVRDALVNLRSQHPNWVLGNCAPAYRQPARFFTDGQPVSRKKKKAALIHTTPWMMSVRLKGDALLPVSVRRAPIAGAGRSWPGAVQSGIQSPFDNG